MTTDEANWARNYRYRARAVVRFRRVDEVQAVVAVADRVHAIGSRHSFNGIADSPGVLVDLADLPDEITIDPVARTVTVSAATRYGDLAARLDAEGWALPNLASLPHISVAGAVATGTHGSGDALGSLATAVAEVVMIDSSGELLTFRRGDPDFDGVVVHLGAVGVVVTLTLDIVKTFQVAQTVHTGLAFERLLDDLDAITGRGYSVSIFTDWLGDTVPQVWTKARVGDAVPDALDGAVPAVAPMHMLPGVDTGNLTEQLGVPGPWHERLPHFRSDFRPSSGDEIQSEYYVARRHATAAIESLRSVGERIAPLLQMSEIRTVAADRLWMSGAYDADGEGSVAIHFTWHNRPALVSETLPVVEAALDPYGARPHWGKAFVPGRHVLDRFPRGKAFRDLAYRLDPRGAFVNEFLTSTHVA